MQIVSGKFVIKELLSVLGCTKKVSLENKVVSMIKTDREFKDLVNAKLNITMGND